MGAQLAPGGDERFVDARDPFERHVNPEPDHDRQGKRSLAEPGRAELSGGVLDEFGFQDFAQAGEGKAPK